uniref:WRKY domain-containing protein n=1 Tax=Daucus carota subsp. sativus TaxID=79200 RepID=A0A166EBI3_DAUCS
MDKNEESTSIRRPMLNLPPRSSVENLFTGASTVSPGPMTLVSSFFSENDPDSDCRSFSQLLAGAVEAPVAADDSGGDLRFKMNRPSGLAVTQPSMFTIPPGLSPACLLDSPGLFSANQGAFGTSHQQALAQVTVQALQSHSQPQNQLEYPSLAAPAVSFPQFTASVSTTSAYQQMLTSVPDRSLVKQSSQLSQSDMRSQPSSLTVDKPADDGYNWRKYGQKHVKGSEYPRSYYKCTHSNCPVKKIVERALDGQVTEIVYKGQHNHQRPQSNKRGKDAGNESLSFHHDTRLVSEHQTGNLNDERSGYPLSVKDQELSLATHEQLSGSSDSEEVADSKTRVFERNEDEPEAKRRPTDVRVIESAASHRTVTEPRIVVQTTSEVDLLDDGFRWRKYGQKVVKGNPYPRFGYIINASYSLILPGIVRDFKLNLVM